MGAVWSGNEFGYTRNDGEVVTCDPSARQTGPSCLVAKYSALKRYLDERLYAIVWTVLGEKLAMGPLTNGSRRYGRMDFSGVLTLEPGGVREVVMRLNYQLPVRRESLPDHSGS